MLDQRHKETNVKIGSERNFGLVFAVFFAGLSVWSAYLGSWRIVEGTAVACAVFLVLALLFPKVLALPNRIWFRIGELLHAVTSPLIMGGIYFLIITPIGVVRRFMGRDPLGLRAEPERETYWIKRTPPGPDVQSMKHQF